MMENCKDMLEVRKSRQVESAIYTQAQAIGICLDRMAELRERLCGVLRDCPCATGKGGDRAQMVPIAESVQNNTDKIDTCTGMINDLLERLEVG